VILTLKGSSEHHLHQTLQFFDFPISPKQDEAMRELG